MDNQDPTRAMPPVRLDGTADPDVQPVADKPTGGLPAWAALVIGLVVGLLLIGGGYLLVSLAGDDPSGPPSVTSAEPSESGSFKSASEPSTSDSAAPETSDPVQPSAPTSDAPASDTEDKDEDNTKDKDEDKKDPDAPTQSNGVPFPGGNGADKTKPDAGGESLPGAGKDDNKDTKD